MQNDYPLAPDKLKIIKDCSIKINMIKMFDKNHKMLFHYQLNIGDDYNISISKVKKLVSNISNKE